MTESFVASSKDIDVFRDLALDSIEYCNSMTLIDDSQVPEAVNLFKAGLIEIMPFDGWKYCYFTEKGRQLAKEEFGIEILHLQEKDFNDYEWLITGEK
jgi:hypothetical protein